MRTVVTSAAKFNPGSVKNIPIVGVVKGKARSHGVAFATASSRRLQVATTIKSTAILKGMEPARSSITVTSDCQFKSFHQARFTWR